MATLSKKRIKDRRKRRLAFYCILTTIYMALVPLLASLIHQLLNGEMLGGSEGLIIKLNYLEAVNLLTQNKNLQKMVVCLILCFVMFLLYLTSDMQQKIIKVDTALVTPEIEIPIAAGNGQYGNARFITQEEKNKMYDKYEYPISIAENKMPEVKGKGGLIVHFEKNRNKESYFYLKEDFHSIAIATSGGGKSRSLLLPTIFIQIQSGLSLVISDVKGELWCYTSKYAETKGYQIAVIDFRTPKKSMHYNFMQPILDALTEKDEAKAIDGTWDLVSVLVGEPKGDPLWTNGESASIAAVILSVAIEAPAECRNTANVYYFLAYMCKSDEMGEMPINKYLKKLPENHPARICFAMADLAPSRTRGSFFTSALGTLRLFVNPNIAALSSESDFRLSDLGKKKTILYIKIPDEKKTYYPLVSLLVTQTYMELVSVANANGQRLPVNVDYNLDEIGNCPLIPVLPSMITAGRSRGIRVNLFIQEYQQLSKYKNDYETILSNCSIKVFQKGDGDKTLKSISESIGKYTVEVSSASTSISDGNKMNANYSSSANLAGRNLLEPAEIKRIKPPHALVMVTGEYSAINYLPDISQTKINQIYGMGNKEHNQKLIMEREYEIQEMKVGDIELWGIWREYEEENECEEERSDPDSKKRVSFLNFADE